MINLTRLGLFKNLLRFRLRRSELLVRLWSLGRTRLVHCLFDPSFGSRLGRHTFLYRLNWLGCWRAAGLLTLLILNRRERWSSHAITEGVLYQLSQIGISSRYKKLLLLFWLAWRLFKGLSWRGLVQVGVNAIERLDPALAISSRFSSKVFGCRRCLLVRRRVLSHGRFHSERGRALSLPCQVVERLPRWSCHVATVVLVIAQSCFLAVLFEVVHRD